MIGLEGTSWGDPVPGVWPGVFWRSMHGGSTISPLSLVQESSNKKKIIIKKEKEKEKRDFGVFSSVQRGFAVLYSSLFCCWEILAVFTPCQQGFVHIHVPWGLLSASSHTKDAPPVPLQEIHWLWSTIGPHTPNVASALRGRWIFRELTQLAWF